MATDAPISDPVDPLHSLFGVSLFARAIRAATNAPMPPDPKDLETVHHFMKSVTLSSSEKVLDEAKAIVDGGSELLKSKFPRLLESLGIDRDAVVPQGKESLQERRPALGLKRPRFTLKSNVSPSVNLEPSVDIGQLQDPVEFYCAFEKAENARREIQRLNGGTISDSENYDPSTNKRARRPGMLGISVNYKHRFSSLVSKSDVNPKSSQATLELDMPSAPRYESQQDNADTGFEAQETNVTGSIVKTHKRLNGILDELLAKNSEDLDGDGALSLLQDRLKMKPIDLGKLSLPDFHDVGRTDFLALGEKLPKARKTLSNISNFTKRLSGETHAKRKRVGESPISPTAHLLKKLSSQSSLLRDPFTPLDVDLSEPRNAYCGDDIDSQPPQVTVPKELSVSGNLESHVENELGRPTTSNIDLQTVAPTASDGLADHLLDKNLHGEIGDADFRPTGTQTDFIECDTGDGLVKNSVCHNTTMHEESINSIIEANRSTENVAERCETTVLSTQFNSHADDSTQNSRDTGANFEAKKVEGVPQLQVVENLYGEQPPLDQPNSTVTKDNPVITPAITAEIVTKKKSKKHQAKEQRKVKRPRGDNRELKSLSRRKSFAEGGTSFDSGVRRSKRIKSRPLQYWKGERFLFGRIKESIKLIGLKYISPGKGDGKLKVKPYVSDDYKEMLDLAARH